MCWIDVDLAVLIIVSVPEDPGDQIHVMKRGLLFE
jgi:hypothetical protein